MPDKEKRRAGDRRDGTLIRGLDAMHMIMPLIYPNRCDNEAYISEKIDLTNIDAYLAKKNEGRSGPPMTLFHVIVAAVARTVTLRPKMNRFIANRNMYQRKGVSAAFVVKKQFADDGSEALAFIHFSDDDTMDTIHAKIAEQIMSGRGEELDSSSESMDILCKMPRFLLKFVIDCIRFLDVHGIVPKSLVATDPYYSSVVLTNLGSIKLHSGYHHLTNWGTNSVFVAVGERKAAPRFDAEGNMTMRETLDIGLTIDERIADGYYYSKTVRLLRKLLENPELLDMRLSEKVEY